MLQPLFFNNKERFLFFTILCVIFIFSLSFKYYEFYKLTSQKNPQITASVLLQYTKTKNNKSYFVLKLQSEFGIFYTTSREDLKDLKYRLVSMRLIVDKLTFFDFLKGFYAPHFNLILLQERDFRESLREFILNQHKTKIMGEYYLALFIADSLPKEWRELAQSYGIAHVFAISGFHTGILSAISFFILGLLYKPLHQRFFPFRNYFFDLGFIVLALLIAYYFLLTQSPSYLRAVAMSAVVFFLLIRGLKVWRLETLGWSVLILLSFMPSLAFSIGFYFSCLGVLYIFLFLKYFKLPDGLWKKILYICLLNASTFILMTIITHFFFTPFSPLSSLSLILTPLFSVYYPFMLFAHIFNIGGILDSILLWWLGVKTHTITLLSNFYLFALCNILSFIACFYRLAFYLLLVLNIGFFSYGVYLYFYTF